MKASRLAVALGLAIGAAGCGGGGGDTEQRAVSSVAPSLSQAREEVWRHVRFTVDAVAGKPRDVTGCYKEGRSVICVVDYEHSCGIFSVTRVGGTLNIGFPSGRRACVHVSGSLRSTTPYVVDP